MQAGMACLDCTRFDVLRKSRTIFSSLSDSTLLLETLVHNRICMNSTSYPPLPQSSLHNYTKLYLAFHCIHFTLCEGFYACSRTVNWEKEFS